MLHQCLMVSETILMSYERLPKFRVSALSLHSALILNSTVHFGSCIWRFVEAESL